MEETGDIMSHIVGSLEATWQVLLDASIFILFGFIIAALIRAFLSSEQIVKYMGGNNFRSVFFAALFGVVGNKLTSSKVIIFDVRFLRSDFHHSLLQSVTSGRVGNFTEMG